MDLKRRIAAYKNSMEGFESYSSDSKNDSKSKSGSSIEESGFNVIQLIKDHLSHGVPLMFHVTYYYAQLPKRSKFNRFVFWIVSFIGQIIDMIFSTLYGIVMLFIALIIIFAIARGVGLIDLSLDLAGLKNG